MKDFDYYSKTKSQYPSIKYMDEFKKNLFQQMETYVGTKKQIIEKEKELTNEVKKHSIDLRNKCNIEKNELKEKFKWNMFGHFGVKTNSKNQMCFDIAWEYGHSEGFSNVFDHFENLVDLIK